jgi:hypothetical protein
MLWFGLVGMPLGALLRSDVVMYGGGVLFLIAASSLFLRRLYIWVTH